MKIQSPFARTPYFWNFLMLLKSNLSFSKIILFLLLAINLFFTACDSGPKVINAETDTIQVSENSIPAFESISGRKVDLSTVTNNNNNAEEHEVVVEEILNTDKYSYLKVKESSDEFWIAISKRDVKLGKTYIYKGGLLKRNFFSREFNRTFETVYLVSNIREKSRDKTTLIAEQIPSAETLPDLTVEKIEPTAGAISLSQLFTEKSKYAGKKIKITGKCMKVNPKIMNRNWIHIQDGSGDQLDLTVTTSESIPLGAIVSLEGTIAVDKDFGAGYRYDIIMEEAVLK